MIDRTRIGIITPLKGDGSELEPVVEFGLANAQVSGWDPELWTADAARLSRDAAARSRINIVAFWAGWPGPRVWDFVDGPATLGIVPELHRASRVAALKSAADFAVLLGVPALVTHLGFLPENPSDPLFEPVVAAIRDLARYMGNLGLEFWFETGQETPVALMRVAAEVGEPNLGVNLDPANLLLYGKANPVDSVAQFGDLIRCVHAKDGHYPTNPMRLGEEVPVGKGAVEFERFVSVLETSGYTGTYIIEREIEGSEQARDIRQTVSYLSGEPADNAKG